MGYKRSNDISMDFEIGYVVQNTTVVFCTTLMI